MSDLMQLEMTLDEARETDRLIKRHINTTRYLLLDMRDRKGWKALGYESFVEYGEKELNFASTHLYRLADAAEISLQIGFSPIGEKSPPETHIRPLKAVSKAARKAIWEEATRKAEEEGAKLTAKRVEDEVSSWKQTAKYHQEIADSTQHELSLERQRTAEWKELWKAERDKKAEPPADYEAFKARAAELAEELKTVKAEQTRIIQSAIKAKLQGYQGEVDALERQKQQIEEIVSRKKAYLESLDSDVKRIETHRGVIDGCRLELISLAAFLNDMDPMHDADTIRRWLALADMHDAAAAGIRQVFGEHRPALTVIQGGAA